MTTLVPSFMDGSSSFLQITRQTIKARIRMNLGKIPSLRRKAALDFGVSVRKINE